jgi:hypothetical protein
MYSNVNNHDRTSFTVYLQDYTFLPYTVCSVQVLICHRSCTNTRQLFSKRCSLVVFLTLTDTTGLKDSVEFTSSNSELFFIANAILRLWVNKSPPACPFTGCHSLPLTLETNLTNSEKYMEHGWGGGGGNGWSPIYNKCTNPEDFSDKPSH